MSEEVQLEEGTWVELRDRAIFRIHGPDRVRYLNGQLSNDVSGALHETAVAGCLCSLKGKVEYLVWVSSLGEELFVDGQIDQREGLAERLDRYLIADDCEVTDVTDDWQLIHHFSADKEGVVSRRTDRMGRDLFVPKEEVFTQGEPEIDLEKFQRAQAAAMIPAFPFEITGNEFPAEMGIASWAVDYAKGCYLGQEVISRMKSVGRVKQHLSLVFCESELRQDASVRTDSGKKGRVTRVVEKKSENHFLALCYLKGSPEEAGALAPQRVEPIDEAGREG